jgi:hypothetical protein
MSRTSIKSQHIYFCILPALLLVVCDVILFFMVTGGERPHLNFIDFGGLLQAKA